MIFFKRIIRKVVISLIFINLFIIYGKELQLPYKIIKTNSNIFFKIFLFYFSIANNYETNFFYDAENYSIEIFIRKNQINNEPSSPSLFETDLFFRIDNIPYNKSGKFDLLVTIRANKKFITFTIPFIIKQKGKYLYLKGEIKELKIKDITKDEFFLKRKEMRILILFDLKIGSNF